MTRPQSRPARATRSWLFGTSRDRLRTQLPLLAAVTSVALLACTLITSLGLLVTNTELEGARHSLTGIPADQTVMQVRLSKLTTTVEEANAAVTAAVHKALGPGVAVTSSTAAHTEVSLFADDAPIPGSAYFAQLDDLPAHATLVSGDWARATSTKDGAIPVAVPQSGATALGLSIGSTLTVNVGGVLTTAEVVGIYAADTKDEDFWALDPLRGTGYSPSYPKPGVTFYQPIRSIGPLVVAPGGLAAADDPVSSLQFWFYPDFSKVAAADLGPMLGRLSTADVDVRVNAGNLSEGFLYNSGVAAVIGSVSTGLVVTRSTVVVVSLLLLVLAIAAMSQTARLLSDSRVGERRLMRSRGASGAQVLAVTVVEAVLIGAATTALSPVLAALVYRLIAAQPAMVAAGMPAVAEITVLSWSTAGAVSVAFVVVLVAPLLGRGRGAVEDARSNARASRSSGFMRSGVDLALVVLAGLAYWQLVSYHGVLDESGSLTIDPVLAVGPALVLLAGALLCVRLLPAASYLVERLGSRSNRVVIPLASWELGRRSIRAVSAVLLLSLALAIGTFGLCYLSTWKQSQLDQASVAVGAPVRVPVDAGKVLQQADRLDADADHKAGQVFRRLGLLDLSRDQSDLDAEGTRVQVLGLSESARSLLDRGRLAEVGGSYVNLVLRPPAKPAIGVDIPADSRTLSATARVTDATGLLTGKSATLRAILESTGHVLTTVDLGEVPVDSESYPVTAKLPHSAGLRLVGLQAAFNGDFALGQAQQESATVAIDVADLAVDGSALPKVDGWVAVNADPSGERATAPEAPKGWELRLNVAVPSGRESAFSLVGWTPAPALLAVVPTQLGDRYQLQPGSLISLTTQSTRVSLQLAAYAPLVPGAAAGEELGAMGYGLGAGNTRETTIVVDQESLARALAQAGVAGTMVDEWWLDVPLGEGQAYVDAHPTKPDAPRIFSSDVLGTQLQQAPLRVATQAALWVSIAAGALLAAVGFAMHTAATLRARRIELAQLQAVGLTRSALVALVAVESLLLCVLGVVFGVSIGILLTSLVGPLVAVSPDGSAPVPSVVIDIPGSSIALLVLGMAVVLALVVLVVAVAQRRTRPADLLRGGAEL